MTAESRGDDAPDVASQLLDLREKAPEPLAAGPQALGVWELAWPTILAFLTQTVVRWADFVMVGSLGPEALAAVGLGGQSYWLVQSLTMVVPTGVVALLARAVGAGNASLADAALRQGLWLAGGLGLVTGLGGLPVVRWAIGSTASSPASWTPARATWPGCSSETCPWRWH